MPGLGGGDLQVTLCKHGCSSPNRPLPQLPSLAGGHGAAVSHPRDGEWPRGTVSPPGCGDTTLCQGRTGTLP